MSEHSEPAAAPARSPDGGQAPPDGRRVLVGRVLLGLLVLYCGLCYYGFGPYDGLSDVPWWHPRAFLVHSPLVGAFDGNMGLAVAAFAGFGLALGSGVFLCLRSPGAWTLALACVLACLLFAFYGLRDPGPRIWEFFRWRGSAVMACLALAIAGTLLAPRLAESWLRWRWPLRLATYLPIVLLVVAASRTITGTDPRLAFNISPWPALTVFGLDGIATAIVGLLGCVALALGAWRHRVRRPPLAWALGMAALVLPVLWVQLRFGGGLLLLATAALLAGAGMGLAATAAEHPGRRLHSAGGYTAVGTLLAALPLLLGQGCARLDYTLTRDGTAQEVIDALARYSETEGEYPDRLEELVESKVLETVPRPQIGFPGLGNGDFSYQNFGTGYLLEFAAPGWVQCAYSPPWEDEVYEEEEEDVELDPEAGPLPGEWSCEDAPPELW